MARININCLKKISKERNTIHEAVYATYSVFDNNDEKYFQIDTYGKTGRVNPEKVSQSIQFDRESAFFLVNLLIEEFHLKLQ